MGIFDFWLKTPPTYKSCSKNSQNHQFAVLFFTFLLKKSTFWRLPFFSDLWHGIALFWDHIPTKNQTKSGPELAILDIKQINFYLKIFHIYGNFQVILRFVRKSKKVKIRLFGLFDQKADFSAPISILTLYNKIAGSNIGENQVSPVIGPLSALIIAEKGWPIIGTISASWFAPIITHTGRSFELPV